MAYIILPWQWLGFESFNPTIASFYNLTIHFCFVNSLSSIFVLLMQSYLSLESLPSDTSD
jgi:hypothetical protein